MRRSSFFTAVLALSFLASCSSTPLVKAPEPLRDLPFAMRESVELRADWHPPAQSALETKEGTPACIVIHGGGWYKGDKGEMDGVARRLAAHGIGALNINYRLAPEHRFPAAVLDVKDAIRWLKANARALGVDPRRVCVFGYSAGAHLSLMAGFTRPGDGLDDTTPPSAKIRHFGNGPEWVERPPSDLSVRVVVGGGTPSNLFTGSYNKYYERLFGRPPTEIPETYRRASPLSYVRAGLPATFLYHGAHDWIVDVEQSRLLRQKLAEAHVDVEYLEVTLGHLVTYYFDEKEVGAAIRFIEARI